MGGGRFSIEIGTKKFNQEFKLGEEASPRPTRSTNQTSRVLPDKMTAGKEHPR